MEGSIISNLDERLVYIILASFTKEERHVKEEVKKEAHSRRSLGRTTADSYRSQKRISLLKEAIVTKFHHVTFFALSGSLPLVRTSWSYLCCDRQEVRIDYMTKCFDHWLLSLSPNDLARHFEFSQQPAIVESHSLNSNTDCLSLLINVVIDPGHPRTIHGQFLKLFHDMNIKYGSSFPWHFHRSSFDVFTEMMILLS